MTIGKVLKFVILLFVSSFLFSQALVGEEIKILKKNFLAPPKDTRLGVYWYWMNEHVSKEGITKDLEAMDRVGIGEAFIGNIYEGGRTGNVKTMSHEWIECMRHAIREAGRLGLKISLFNSPGWSQSGGPWVKPEDAMRFLAYSETIVDGGYGYSIDLEQPGKDFQDVAVLAIPQNEICPGLIKMHTSVDCLNEEALWDNNKETKATFRNKQKEDIIIDFQLNSSFVARSLTLYPTGMKFSTECALYAWMDGEYRLVSKDYFDRSNNNLQLGPVPDGKMVMAFKEIKADRFRIRMNHLPANFELSGISLSNIPKLRKVTEKTLSKLPNTSNPSWGAYRWEMQPLSDYESYCEQKNVLILDSYVKDGHLTWDAPIGVKWKILRMGMMPTYTTNTPAAPSAKGLEIDKLSREVVKKHFEAFIGKVISGMKEEELKALNRIIVDSYEVGPQNWSDCYRAKFIKKTGYDPIPFLPVIAGEIIESVEISERFLWDMRRVIADLVAEEYVGGLRDIAHENQMTLWLENYGHWGYPSEFLYYGGQSDAIGGEFWIGGAPGPECRLASSACHTYGKNEVYAESYTAGGNAFKWHPGILKQKGDWSYTEGVNKVILHVYIHQPYEDKIPGVNAWFGVEFNRHNTWFNNSKAWIDYQRRCSYLLQQGNPVRDLCFFIGEDAPQMNYWIDDSLSNGYSFDLINGDVILNRLKVKDGKLVLPNGIMYSALVLPPLETMRPELLTCIKRLVDEGAVLVGNAPKSSPSLKGYPQCDKMIQSTAQELFPGIGMGMRRVGKGKIFNGMRINDVLDKIGVSEDVYGFKNRNIKWIHRTFSEGEIYFLSNQDNERFEGNLIFRVNGLIPEFWNAVDGSIRPVKSFKDNGNETVIPMKLEVGESVFIVFSHGKALPSSLSIALNYPSNQKIMGLASPWTVSFENSATNEKYDTLFTKLSDWTVCDASCVKYFSGKATYSTTFYFKKRQEKPVYIHFDDIKVMGTVYLNGKELATLWTPPFETELTDVLVDGKNYLEVKVVNLWVNQLIRQYQESKEQKTVWTSVDAVKPGQSLESSGIMGECYLFTK